LQVQNFSGLPKKGCKRLLFVFILFIVFQDVSFFKKRFCFFIEREHARAQGAGAAEGEANSSLSREPNVGLDPRTLGS